MTDRLLAALGALYGLLGVAAAAAAAHLTGGGLLGTAANFLLFHAPALIGLALAARTGLMRPKLARIAGGLVGLGVFLFSGDLALKALAGLAPLPMAAPTGGTLIMLGWLVAAVAALGARGE